MLAYVRCHLYYVSSKSIYSILWLWQTMEHLLATASSDLDKGKAICSDAQEVWTQNYWDIEQYEVTLWIVCFFFPQVSATNRLGHKFVKICFCNVGTWCLYFHMSELKEFHCWTEPTRLITNLFIAVCSSKIQIIAHQFCCAVRPRVRTSPTNPSSSWKARVQVPFKSII